MVDHVADSSSLVVLRAAACEAACAAGAIIRRAFGQARTYQHKSRSIDLVTETDRAAERCIESYVAERFPLHGLLGEEGAAREAESGQPTWIVDPLDGTTNFAHGVPTIAASIGVVAAEGTRIVGAVYDPLRDELFSAAKGCGAWMGSHQIFVSRTNSLDASLIATGFPYDRRERAAYYGAFVEAVLERAQGVRRGGAAAIDLAWVAAGRYDAYWELGLQPWDVAAGSLIVEEAGGTITDETGAALDLNAGRTVASNSRVHRELLQVLSAAQPIAAKRSCSH